MVVDVAAIRICIADHLASQSWWREQKAEEYPEDDRNARAARTLAQLAVEAASLPDNDPNLVALAEMGERFGEPDPYVLVSFGDECGREVTSALYLWNTYRSRDGLSQAEPTLNTILGSIRAVTEASWVTHEQEAREWAAGHGGQRVAL